jgi:hypothetical protein
MNGCQHACERVDVGPLCAGRAGAKGTAITFIAPEDERYAPDLVKALKESGARAYPSSNPWQGGH